MRPGGHQLPRWMRAGPPAIDLHLAGLRELGAQIREEGGFLHATAPQLRGRTVVLRLPSVGATENLILAACGAEGTTVLSNAAREPEIEDLQSFLNACGGDVRGAGTSTVVIRGGRTFHGGTYRVMPDRIAAATYLCALASAGGTGFLRGARGGASGHSDGGAAGGGVPHLRGARGDRLCLPGAAAGGASRADGSLSGFPTDAQAVLMAALLRARGATAFEENIFENRYRHVDELARMGADIRVMGRVAVVTGVETLHGAPGAVHGPAGRGGALCGGPGGGGESCISETAHIARGYEDIARDLGALGADIRWGGENNRSEQE